MKKYRKQWRLHLINGNEQGQIKIGMNIEYWKSAKSEVAKTKKKHAKKSMQRRKEMVQMVETSKNKPKKNQRNWSHDFHRRPR